MRDGFKSAAVLKLSLHFLEGDDLGGRTGANGEHLPQQRGTPHRTQRQYIAANCRLDNGVAHVSTPAREILLKLNSAGIRAKVDEMMGGLVRQKVKSLGQ